jgi:hypothetical protein
MSHDELLAKLASAVDAVPGFQPNADINDAPDGVQIVFTVMVGSGVQRQRVKQFTWDQIEETDTEDLTALLSEE